jgi:hypothetical protein
MNPDDPGPWVQNDADAVIAAVEQALVLTGGRPHDPASVKPPPP